MREERFRNTRIVLLIILTALAGCQKISDPPEPVLTIDFSGCIIPGTASTLEVVTFNIQAFPKSGMTTVDATAQLIRSIDADVVALQEITSETALNNLIDRMPGWSGLFYPIDNGNWNLAYLFKDSEITVHASTARVLFTGDSYAFPRPPFEVKITHKPTGITAYIINLHLKALGGSANIARRRDAAEKLHAYLTSERAGDKIIMPGDWNDVIGRDMPDTHPFSVFLSDTLNFRFTTMSIATGSHLWWSYPSWPSHIDQILVNSPLFSRVDTTITYKAEPCYPAYSTTISDHRPVGVVLR